MLLTAKMKSLCLSRISKFWKESMPSKQLKMLLGWAAFHQDELMENWKLAQKKQELFEIEPLK